MTTPDPILDISDLPPRARAADPDELADVFGGDPFGGCAGDGEECHGDKECCFGMCHNDHCL